MACGHWSEFTHTLRNAKVKGASWRNLLAFHTSQCCAAKGQKETRMIVSLKEAGLDTVRDSDMGTEGFNVSVTLDHLFQLSADRPRGHELPSFTCVSFLVNFRQGSPDSGAVQEAQEQACFHTLAFLLCLAPSHVHVHPNSVTNVDEVRRSTANMRCQLAVIPPASGTWRAWSGVVAEFVIPPQPPPTARTQYEAPAKGGQDERDREVIQLLSSPWKGKGAFVDPSRFLAALITPRPRLGAAAHFRFARGSLFRAGGASAHPGGRGPLSVGCGQPQ